MSVVEVTNLSVRYANLTAVNALSFNVEAGQVVSLLGPNGAGKTSTVECLEGYRPPYSGSVRVLGLDPVNDHRLLVPRIGVMLQRGGVYPMLAPRRLLNLFASYYSSPMDSSELLEIVSLTDVAGTQWRSLSGGEQQRLSLALALIGKPEVLFLDEPTAGVDPEGRVDIREVISLLKEQGVGVLLTTHELAEAEKIADRVIIIKDGAVLAEGTIAELASTANLRLGDGGATSFAGPPGLDITALSGAIRVSVTETSPGKYVASGPASPSLTAALATWFAERDITLHDLRTGLTLEEIYLRVIGETAASDATSSEAVNRIATATATRFRTRTRTRAGARSRTRASARSRDQSGDPHKAQAGDEAKAGDEDVTQR